MCFLATLLIVVLAGCGQETVTIPGVVSVTPAQGSTNVALNAVISATFSQPMSASSINTTTFTVSAPGGVAVMGAVAYSGNTATFTPTGGALAYNTTYTATITAGAATPGGAELIGPITWSFTTLTAPTPAVVSVTPAQGAANVAVNAVISATFSQAMSAASTSAFTLAAPGGVAVAGTAALDATGKIATFTPTGGALAYNTTYTATITTAATSTLGIPIVANYVWSFTTITPAPAVVFTVPVNGATGVPVGQVLRVRFNEAMLCSTLATPATTFTLTGPGATPVAGTVSCSGNFATFTPNLVLAFNTVYTATVSAAATDLAGTPLAGAYVWTFRTVPAPPPPPVVISTVPVNGAPPPIVPISQVLTATFSEAMDPATINSATFLLTVTGGATVNGVITYDAAGSVAAFAPNAPLAYSTSYTATITSGALDLNDDMGVATYTWTFTTAVTPLTVAPTVVSTVPATLPVNLNVPLNQVVSAVFSEAMNPTTINGTTFTLTGPGVTPVLGLVAYAAIGNELVFVPTANLLPGTTYTATITTGVQDLTGDALAATYMWTFKTGTGLSTTPPLLVNEVPASGATNVAINQAVSATFSEAMDPLTLTNATFQLYAGQTASGTPIPATITYDAVNFIATLTPTNPLAISSYYTATVTIGATDLAGTPLGSAVLPIMNPWTFQTGTAVIVPPVVLGPTILPFGGNAGSAGMTNTGINTVIHGDVGTTATGFSSLTGLHDDTVVVAGVPQCVYTETGSNIGLVTGEIYSPLTPAVPFACPEEGTAATIAIADEALAEATTAYNTLQGLPSGGVLAAELGGTTIYPGVYTNASSVGITAGDLTLDAQGDPNATWVFQIGSTLTVGLAATPANVILKNGAKPSNIFWAVGTDMYLNPSGGGTFEGTVIAYDFIHVSTVGNAAITTINGRLLALNASITLVNTVINVPTP
jgi:hypothetical protein